MVDTGFNQEKIMELREQKLVVVVVHGTIRYGREGRLFISHVSCSFSISNLFFDGWLARIDRSDSGTLNY